MSVLSGVRIIEIESIGPAPFCGMLLADLGADVIVIDRPGGPADPITDAGDAAIHRRGKRAIELDLKSVAGRETAFKITETADGLIEGLRPGAMERLGLGPDECRGRKRELVYGRVTGWGQDGPLAKTAGHDINYIALSGALWYAGRPGEPPMAPATLVGDLGGGALYLAVGMLAGILSARATGEGCVVDAAIVDGSAHLMNLLLAAQAIGGTSERGKGLLDGPHWYDTYRCKDGEFISVGALEAKFYAKLLEALGLAADPEFVDAYDAAQWPRQRERLQALFATKTRDEWAAQLEGGDACFAPVLRPEEAALHPHMAARGVYRETGGVLQAAAAPRFNGATPGDPPRPCQRGEHTEEILRELGAAKGGK